MAHVVCITGGLSGIFNASLALAGQLQHAGHRVTYASPHDVGDAARAAGLDFVQLAPWQPRPAEPRPGPWLARLASLRSCREAAAVATGAGGFAEAMSALEPDLVLIDIEMAPHIMQGIRAGLRIALLSPFIALWKRPGLPPVNSLAVPGQGLAGSRTGIATIWAWNGLRMRLAVARDWVRTAGLDYRSVLRAYARRVGLPFRAQYGDRQWLVPWCMPDLPIICVHAAEFDFPHDPHPSMHYTGPMVRVDRPEPRVSADDQARLDAILARRAEAGQTLIYCAFSTYAPGAPEHLRKVYEVARARPNWEFIVGLGGGDPTDALALPNLHVFTYAPQLRVLAHADAAIIDGGCNTIDECVHFGVPMLSYPLDHACQRGSAARLGYHGLGHVGDRRRDGPEMMLAALENILANEGIRTRLAAFQEVGARYESDARAARIIEGLIAS